jgi:hypothetical protein
MDTRLNGTVTALRIAIGLMPTLAGLDKFFNLLANWEAYVAPKAQQLLPISAGAFMGLVGVIEFTVGITTLAIRPSLGAYVASSGRGCASAAPTSYGIGQHDWEGDVRAYDAVYDHILMMSDALSDGIVKQFPDKFRASQDQRP